jgi:hypothetical protein
MLGAESPLAAEDTIHHEGRKDTKITKNTQGVLVVLRGRRAFVMIRVRRIAKPRGFGSERRTAWE